MSGANDTDESSSAIGEAVTVAIENLGGIESASVTVQPGVTILSGENATNRTSFLRSLASVLGGRESAVMLKSDADSGRVTLSTAEESYSSVYTASGIDVTNSRPLSPDSSVVDAFVAIDERNPARRAIRSGGDGLRDLLMAPVDTSAIRADIRTRKAEQSKLETELARIKDREAQLPDLKTRKGEVEAELEAVTAELDDLQTEIEDTGDDGSTAQTVEDLYAKQSRLRESIGESDRILGRQREKVDELEVRRDRLAAELDDLEVETERLTAITDELDRRKRQVRDLDSFTNDIAAVLEVNRDLLEDEYSEMSVDENLTASLDPSTQAIQCWTCGSEVAREQVTDRLESMRELLHSKRTEREEIAERISDLESRAGRIERDKRQKARLQDELEETEDELELRRDRINDLQETLEERRAELADLESDLENEAADGDGELANRYRRLSEMEYERGRLSEERSRLDAEIEQIERLVTGERPSIEAGLDTLAGEIESLRDRVETLERTVIETFDEHVNELVDLLGYRNIERVWLERRAGERTGSEDSSEFVLHVVREGPDGAVYEDTVETLSESERELIGIVVAIVGYLVHDVDEQVPFVLLDSVESIDADRLATILEYVGGHVRFLLAAVLPEEAVALPDSYTRISADVLHSG